MDDLDDDYEFPPEFLAAMDAFEGGNSTEGQDNKTLSHNTLRRVLDGEPPKVQLAGCDILVLSLCVIAILVNSITLTAIRHIRRRLTANQTMMFSLCCADLLTAIGVLAQSPVESYFRPFGVTKENRPAAFCVTVVVKGIIMTGHNATLFNLLCLAVDHYCAIAKPLTHGVYMSKRRVHFLLVGSWFTALLFGFSDFLIPTALNDNCKAYPEAELLNYCERVWCTWFEPDHLMFAVVAYTLAGMSILYGRIICILYSYQQQDYVSDVQRKAKRHVRGLVTSFIILGLFMALWMPACILDIVTIVRMSVYGQIGTIQTHMNLYWYLYALVLLNAICDPIIYAMRMREIQESLMLLLCFRRPTLNKVPGFPPSSSFMPMKPQAVHRQCSNVTTSTMCSNNTYACQENRRDSRKSTLTSQTSDIQEESLLGARV